MEEMEGKPETLRRVLEEAFGGSSSDSEEESHSVSDQFLSRKSADNRVIWESVDGIKGLWLCRDFLSGKHQSLLLSAIEREGWFSEGSHNQAMRFGDIPEWATELAGYIREAACFGDVSLGEGRKWTARDQRAEESCPLPFDLLWREPFFDQLIVNVYKPGEGICPHVDLLRFEDGIAIVSMESACVMHFTKAGQPDITVNAQGSEEGSSTRIPVFLNPGCLVLMSGDARYLWRHEINRKPGAQLWEGKEIDQRRRISVTLRKLCPSPNQS